MPNSAFKQQYSSDRVGQTGNSGYSGYSGYSGISGYNQVAAATSGYSGYSGVSFSGYSGYSAYSGTSGYILRTGMVMSITGVYVESTGTVAQGGNNIVLTYTIPDNSYSFIRVRSCGSLGSQDNTNTTGGVYAVIGSTSSSPISFRADATGSGNLQIKPFMVEEAVQQTSSTNIYIKVLSTAGTVSYMLDSFVVEGIV